MRKTIFSGLTVLGPEDSLFADGAAFTTRDRDEIDRGLKIGVKTHRHTGLPGLSNPIVAPSASIIGSGGTIDSGLTITVGYTLEDTDGGETTISPLSVTSTPTPLDVPLNAPEAEADYTAGNLLTDNYTYAITYTDGEGGETPLGPATLINRDPGFANAQIKLKGLTTGMEEAGAVGWRLFRARGGGEFVLLATGDETEDTFTDDGSVSPDCDTHPPTDNVNNTNKVSTLQVKLPSGLASGATFINLYATTTGSFGESSLLAQYPIASAGAKPTFPALEFLSSQPPDVNRSYGGANKIDPDTELLDWHWKRPVASVGALPSSGNEEGDVRAILGAKTPTLYMFLSGKWQQLETGGGGGGGGFAGSASAVKMVAASGGLGFVDHFTGNKLDGNWGEEFGKLNFLKVENGKLLPSKEIAGIGILAERGPFWSDGTVEFLFHTGPENSATGLSAGLRARCKKGTNKGVCFTFSSGSWATIQNEVSGEVLAEEIGPTLEPNKDYWFRAILDGNFFKMEIWDTNPALGGKPLYSLSGEVTKPTEKAQIGAGIYGNMRWWLPPVKANGWWWDDFNLMPGDVFLPGTAEFIGASGIVVLSDGPDPTRPQITIAASGLAAGINVLGSGSAVAGAETSGAEKLELIGSGGVNVKESTNGKAAKAVIEGQAATLMNEGMGVIVIPVSQKGMPRPKAHKQYTWFCKEKPTNMAEFDIWMEEGP